MRRILSRRETAGTTFVLRLVKVLSSTQRQEVGRVEEQELLRRMGRGDTAALEEAMDRHMAFSCGLAGSVLRGYPRDAEEVVSDAFLALWEHAGQIQTTGKFAILCK